MLSEEPPLKLRLAAFCKIVLTEAGTAEHSLIGFLPAINLGITLPKDQPVQQLSIPFMTGLAIFALFERSTRLDDLYDVELEVRISGPFEKPSPLTSNLKFPPGVKFTQMPIKFQNPTLNFSLNSEKEVQETEIKVQWVLNDVIIGEATLPISVKVMEPTDANADDLSTTDKS